MPRRSPERLLELLQSKPVVEFGEIQAALAEASRSTAFRYLQQVAYRSSYSHNGRYYTMHCPSKYDRWGLYSVGDVHFSMDGTLKATVVRLVRDSETGWTQRELQELLRVRVQPFLMAALRGNVIARERIGMPYVYFHVDREVRAEQLQHRSERAAVATVKEGDVAVEVALRVVLVLLRYPGSKPGDVMCHLKGRSPPISRSQVVRVFVQYGLGEKGGPRIF